MALYMTFYVFWLYSLGKQLCQHQTSTGPMPLASGRYHSGYGTLGNVDNDAIILSFGAFWL